jgi:hypothetical protein
VCSPGLLSAIAFTRAQLDVLAQCRVELEALKALAELAQREAPAAQSHLAMEFSSRARRLRELNEQRFQGGSLLGATHTLIELEEGNALVLAGIETREDLLGAVLAVDLDGENGAAGGQALVTNALHWLTIAETISEANLTRLTLLCARPDVARQALTCAASRKSAPAAACAAQ